MVERRVWDDDFFAVAAALVSLSWLRGWRGLGFCCWGLVIRGESAVRRPVGNIAYISLLPARALLLLLLLLDCSSSCSAVGSSIQVRSYQSR